MERCNLKLEKNQYLNDTWMFKDGTPSNFIIFKKLCGLGATHGEATIYKRHSIIIVPNTPVLKGKQEALLENGEKKYKDILAVYEGVEYAEVVDYLESPVEFKKILCTPEAYSTKVKPAIESLEQGYYLFEDFFMLIDECDKIIKDVDFRESIAEPMDDFFQFKNKAMISATAVLPSDSRFELNGFKRLYIKPQFNYKQKIDLINTNNIIAALSIELDRCGTDKVFIFLNSVDLIHAIIKLLDIRDKSKVFCADKSKTKLKDLEFTNASTELQDFAQYNFLTCRFFTAVDLFLDEKPHVIMISDVLRKAFSMLDPYSDSTQITGRFRNGVKHLTHISNYNSNLKWKERLHAILYLNDSYIMYKRLREMAINETSEGGKDTLTQAMEKTKIKAYIKANGELDPYLVDNFILEQKTTGYYTHKEHLKTAYIHTSYFKPNVIDRFYQVNDSLIMSLELKSTKSLLLRNVSTMLHHLNTPAEEGHMQFTLGRNSHALENSYPEIAEFYKNVGYSLMESLNFDWSKIARHSKSIARDIKLLNPKMILKIKSLYTIGEAPSELMITSELQVIYNEYGIEKTPKATHIKEYYQATRSTNKEKNKVYRIEGIK